MQALLTFKTWMHRVHDNGAKVTHSAGRMLHEGRFWAIIAIVALIAALFVLAVFFGEGAVIPENYRMPAPYGLYY